MSNMKEFKIGRMSDCDIKIHDAGLSRVQCTIKHDENNNWVLYDGAGVPERKSTNGTWVYVDEHFEIYDQMVFRSCNYLFQTRIISWYEVCKDNYLIDALTDS